MRSELALLARELVVLVRLATALDLAAGLASLVVLVRLATCHEASREGSVEP